MKTARWLSVLLALVLVASACDDGGDGGTGDTRPTRGVKRGTLRVYSHTDVDALDPGVAYATFDFALLRGMVRELYSFDTRLTGERSLVPVPDLADGPLPALGRRPHLHLPDPPRGQVRPAGRPRGRGQRTSSTRSSASSTPTSRRRGRPTRTPG